MALRLGWPLRRFRAGGALRDLKALSWRCELLPLLTVAVMSDFAGRPRSRVEGMDPLDECRVMAPIAAKPVGTIAKVIRSDFVARL